jgi:hypothetical protein
MAPWSGNTHRVAGLERKEGAFELAVGRRTAWLATNVISGGFSIRIARVAKLGDQASITRAAYPAAEESPRTK